MHALMTNLPCRNFDALPLEDRARLYDTRVPHDEYFAFAAASGYKR